MTQTTLGIYSFSGKVMVVLHLQVIFLKVFKELQEPEFLSPSGSPMFNIWLLRFWGSSLFQLA